MPRPAKSVRPSHEGSAAARDSDEPSNNLWVGNLAPDVTDADLMDLFAQYGALDSVTSYSARSYAFVYFKRVEDAKAAKNALQGFSLRGNSLKIEFARPAKPCKQLWVGGISPAVTKEELEAEFRKFGKIEDFKFFRDRNTACIEFFNLDDATQAMKVMNGKRLGGEHIRVDFLRSHSTRKDQSSDYGQFQGKGYGHTDPYTGQKRPLHSQPPMGRKSDSQPSNILWIGYPPAIQIDEQMLHNAMILFGEIERIKSFPSRNYSLVEFRSVDEARRAKEGLQGRLFNDPRITIMYSSNESGKDYPGLYAGSGPRTDAFMNDHPFRPLQMDSFGHNRPVVPNNFPGQLPPGGILGPNAQMRPFGPQGSLEPLISGPEFNEMGMHHKFQDGSSKGNMGPNRKRPSPPAPGMLSPSPASGVRLPSRSASGGWDVLDINHIPRESKRMRLDGTMPVDDVPYPLRNVDDRVLGMDQTYGLDPVSTRLGAGVLGAAQPDADHIWRGIIAKGGTPVCQARCVPIGKGIAAELPEVVDCSARTGLDILTKHYADAIGFDIVFFLPDSEEDFASYTEFLRYLSAKNRAGVAKFADNTTLFLVPPSDFLTKVLKVTGPERLYGVVLKFPPVPGNTPMQQSSHLPIPSSQYMQQIPPSQAEYGLISAKEEPVLPTDYNRLLHDESKLPPKPVYPATSGPPSLQAGPPDYPTGSMSQAGVGLTPELIAALTNLIPGTTQSSTIDGAKSAVGSSTVRPPFPPVAPNDGNQSHLWKQDHQIVDQSVHPPQNLGSMYNIHNAHYQPYPPQSAPGFPNQVVPGSSHIQDTAAGLQQQGAVSSRQMTNYMIPSHSGQVAAPTHVSQQYQVEASPGNQGGYGVLQGTDASGLYNSQAFQQPNNSVAASTQVQSVNPSQQHGVLPYTLDQVNADPNSQQHPLYGVGQGSTEVEADKNQRYQSTLQFAANLLFQIQQQQQQQPPGGHGSGIQ
ncbi:flowering time control protein FPA [Arachis duranensis]|uniref:Flowering time control protein FPA n=1 Tax=Arachis duranensis TaxID=130453 RepID=A0A6P4CKZ7_ARADU|nr:flowering time control protein FPA [Arachis duranensis]XP_015952122.1 flowering time control protein FPA [Arachis duranensis]